MSLSRSIVYVSEHNIMSVLKNDFPNFPSFPKKVIYVSNIKPIKHTPLNFQISSNIPRSRVLLFHICTEMTLKFFVHFFIHTYFYLFCPFLEDLLHRTRCAQRGKHTHAFKKEISDIFEKEISEK